MQSSQAVTPKAKTLTQGPHLTVVGTCDDLVRENGKNNEDGWTYSKLANANLTPRPIAKPSLLSALLFRHQVN